LDREAFAADGITGVCRILKKSGGFALVHENVNAAAASNDSRFSSSVVDWG
jgi:hypothetical protein